MTFVSRTFAATGKEFDPTPNLEEIALEMLRMETEARRRRKEGLDDEGMDEVAREAKELGLPAEAIAAAMATAEEAIEARQKGPIVGIWPESVPAMELWYRVDHMWVYGPMGGRVCLKWETIDGFLRRTDDPEQPTSREATLGLAVLERTIVLNQRFDE